MLEEEKEESILHLLIFLLFFLPDFPKFLILSFFFVFLFREFPLDTLLVLANWWKISFPSSEIVLMFPSFLKDIFSGCKILGWVLFSFNSWKIFHHLFVTCIIFVMKFIVIKIVFPPKERYHFAVAVFKIFSLPMCSTGQSVSINLHRLMIDWLIDWQRQWYTHVYKYMYISYTYEFLNLFCVGFSCVL